MQDLHSKDAIDSWRQFLWKKAQPKGASFSVTPATSFQRHVCTHSWNCSSFFEHDKWYTRGQHVQVNDKELFKFKFKPGSILLVLGY